MKKRIISILLAGLMAISVTACSNKDSADTDTGSKPGEPIELQKADTATQSVVLTVKEHLPTAVTRQLL